MLPNKTRVESSNLTSRNSAVHFDVPVYVENKIVIDVVNMLKFKQETNKQMYFCVSFSYEEIYTRKYFHHIPMKHCDINMNILRYVYMYIHQILQTPRNFYNS